MLPSGSVVPMASPRVLNDVMIRTARCPEKGQKEIWDAQIPGFGVRISQGGTKCFVLMYYAQGRRRRFTLGRYPSLTLAKARAQAHGALEKIASGEDPSAKKSEARRRLTAESFDRLVEEFIEKYAQQRNRGWQETRRILTREFGTRWGSHAVGDITKRDVTAAIDSIVQRGSPGSAMRSFAILRRFFNWCAERGVVDVSPCQGLRTPVAATSRDRVLTDAELRAIWNASETMGYPFGQVVQLLILSAQRKGEVIGAQWNEVDLKAAVWTLAAERTKSKRKHSVPLSSFVVDIVQTLPRIDDALLFPSNGGSGPISGFSKWKERLDAASAVSEWRLHDLRRTAATGMASLGVAPHVIERILNHTTGTLGGVAGVYNRFQYLPEMRDALEGWAEHVRKLASPAEHSA